MPENNIQRGEVYFLHFDPTFGREIGGYKERPAAVVSINDFHRKTRIVAVVPGTSTPSNFPNVVRVSANAANGLRNDTFFQCHHVRAVDQGRMTRGAVGRLAPADLRRIEEALRMSLGLAEAP